MAVTWFLLGGYLVSSWAVILFCLFYGFAMSGEKEDMDALCFLIESVPTPLMNTATKLVYFSLSLVMLSDSA